MAKYGHRMGHGGDQWYLTTQHQGWGGGRGWRDQLTCYLRCTKLNLAAGQKRQISTPRGALSVLVVHAVVRTV